MVGVAPWRPQGEAQNFTENPEAETQRLLGEAKKRPSFLRYVKVLWAC